MPESDDIRTLVPLAAADLAAEDLVQLFDASTNSWKKIPATEFVGSLIGFTAPTYDALATGTLTFSGNAVANQTVTIGTRVYTWKASVSTTADEVLVGATAEGSIENLSSALSAGSGSGTLFGSDTTTNLDVHPETSDATTLTVEAEAAGIAGNLVATTETMTNAAWGAVTLTGGVVGTSAPPYIRIAGGFIYAKSGGVWKSVAIS